MFNITLWRLIDTKMKGMHSKIMLSNWEKVATIFRKNEVHCNFTQCILLWISIWNGLTEKYLVLFVYCHHTKTTVSLSDWISGMCYHSYVTVRNLVIGHWKIALELCRHVKEYSMSSSSSDLGVVWWASARFVRILCCICFGTFTWWILGRVSI